MGNAFQMRNCELKKDEKTGKMTAVWGKVNDKYCPLTPCAPLEKLGDALDTTDCEKKIAAGKSCEVVCTMGKHKGKKAAYTCPSNNGDKKKMPQGSPPECLRHCKGGLPFKLTGEQEHVGCDDVKYGGKCIARCKKSSNKAGEE